MKRVIALILVTICVLALTFPAIAGKPPPVGSAIIIQNSVLGKTPEFYGTVEGGHWNVADLVDCKMNSVRLYCDMSRIEPTDDDGVYGSPTIAQIKANPGIIPWSVWDARINDASLWGTGVSLGQIFADCAANGIQPLICIRTSDINMLPAWAPQPPFDDADRNEVWEFCFALAYWCNVRHNYGFIEWQSFNEPDRDSQGWIGTDDEYAEFVRIAWDGFIFANNMAGLTTWNHAGNSPGWGPLDAACRLSDPEKNVDDYHYYKTSQVSQGQDAAQRDDLYGTDGVRDILWNSEWGTYTSSYSGTMGMTIADDLYEFATFDTTVGKHCRGTSIFVMWDWGGYDGLVNADGSKNATYWAHRLMNRGLQGGKDRLQADGAGSGQIATRDANNIYYVVISNSATLTLNLSAVGITNGTATLYYYQDVVYNDVVVGNPVVSNGVVSFTGISGGVALLVVPR